MKYHVHCHLCHGPIEASGPDDVAGIQVPTVVPAQGGIALVPRTVPICQTCKQEAEDQAAAAAAQQKSRLIVPKVSMPKGVM